MRADLHTHSVFSDGEKTPRDLILEAKAAGVEAFSITDHDVSVPCDDLSAFAREQGILFLPGIEFTTFQKEQIHVLGYCCQRTPAFLSRLEEVRKERAERNREILRRLKDRCGVVIEEEEIDRNASGFYGTLQIIRIIRRRGLATTYQNAMEKFFDTGAPAYVSEKRLTPKEAISIIREAGGFPVLAHPGKLKTMDFSAQETLLKELIFEGLSGIESYYSSHTEKEMAAYAALAKKYGLLSTVGSDFHGKERTERIGYPVRDLSREELSRLCENYGALR